MTRLLDRREDECNRFRGLLEEAAAARPGASNVNEFLELLPAATRQHFEVCGDCREAAHDLLAVRQILKTSLGPSPEAEPWFTGRVMAAIAAREKELEESARTWRVLPRFASRLSLVSAALLLIASTWLYERPTAKSKRPDPATSEYLFEAPQPPVNQDDVLVSMAERQP